MLSVFGAPGSRPSSITARPAARHMAAPRFGLQALSLARSFTRPPPLGMRIALVRLLLPQHVKEFVDCNGYWLPNSFAKIGTIGEYLVVRKAAAFMDLSPLRKNEVTGPDAEAMMQLCVNRNVKKLSVGQVS